LGLKRYTDNKNSVAMLPEVPSELRPELEKKKVKNNI
jgi:hypothetical protein